MSENTVAKRDAAPKPPIESGGPIAALVPTDLDQAYRLSVALAKSGDMVPTAFKGKPEQIMAAVIKGMEVGLAPMQALASIAVINGRAVIWGDAIPAMVQRAGHHIDCELEGEGEKMVAVARLTRGDTGKVVERRFSMADAKRAGLIGKQGPWTQYPQRMLQMRARTWAARDGAADALMGLQVQEEVQDYGPDMARDVTPRPAKGRAVYLPTPEPEVDAIVEHEAGGAEPDAAAPAHDPEEEARAFAELEEEQRQLGLR